MGSFDDAIRQHLDLKRRRGADPREVAEMEREALGAESFEQASAAGSAHTRRSGAPNADAPRDPIDWSQSHRLEARRSHLSQDTEEVDMEAVIGAARVELPVPAASAHRAYDWSADASYVDIADPTSDFAWETPPRMRLRGAA